MADLLFKGMVNLTGSHDAGKSLAALQCGAAPDRIAFYDTDIKASSTVSQIVASGATFGKYVNMTQVTKGMKELAVYDAYRKEIDAIEKDRYDCVIFDTWSELSKSIKPWVSKNRNKVRDTWSPMGQLAGAEEWVAAADIETEIISELLEKTQMLFVITHLKNYYVGNKRVEGKSIPDCREPVVAKSLLRLWLQRNPISPVPQALVLKRLSKTTFTDGRIRTVNVLPLKIVPRPESESIWDEINYFWANPCGNRLPTEEEKLTEYEYSVIENTLTSDQRMSLRLAIAESEEESAMMSAFGKTAEPRPDLTDEVKERIKTLASEGKAAPAIRKILEDEGVTVALVDVAKASK